MLARAVYARYNDELAVQVICTSDGTAIYPLEEFVCSNEGGVLADGILMFGATHLDFLSEMPVIAPKHEFTVAVKPVMVYRMQLYINVNQSKQCRCIQTEISLIFGNLQELALQRN